MIFTRWSCLGNITGESVSNECTVNPTLVLDDIVKTIS